MLFCIFMQVLGFFFPDSMRNVIEILMAIALSLQMTLVMKSFHTVKSGNPGERKIFPKSSVFFNLF